MVVYSERSNKTKTSTLLLYLNVIQLPEKIQQWEWDRCLLGHFQTTQFMLMKSEFCFLNLLISIHLHKTIRTEARNALFRTAEATCCSILTS